MTFRFSMINDISMMHTLTISILVQHLIFYLSSITSSMYHHFYYSHCVIWAYE